MTDRRTDISEWDLLAYADGTLDPHRRAQVEAYLKDDPKTAERLRDYVHQTEIIKAMYDPVLDEPVPDRLNAVLHGQAARRPRVRIVGPASAVAASIMAGAIGWWVGQVSHVDRSTGPNAQPFLEQVRSAYWDDADSAMAEAGHATFDDRDGALSWLANQTVLELQAPDLGDSGYELVNSRIVPTDDKQVVELMYEDHEGRSVSLYLRTRWDESSPQFHMAEGSDINAAYWFDGPLAYAIAGAEDSGVLVELGRKVHQRLRLTPKEEGGQMEAGTQVDTGGQGAIEEESYATSSGDGGPLQPGAGQRDAPAGLQQSPANNEDGGSLELETVNDSQSM